MIDFSRIYTSFRTRTFRFLAHHVLWICRRPISLFSVVACVSVIALLSGCGSGGTKSDGINSGGGDSCNWQQGGHCSITFAGTQRTFELHIPANYQQNTSALVFVLHGSSGTGAGVQSWSGMDTESDQHGFAVAYPDSVTVTDEAGRNWNFWNAFFNDALYRGWAPDDVGYLRTLIDKLQTNIHPNPKNIYVAGISNGGMMAHKIGTQLSNQVAAIGVVSGSLYANFQGQSVPKASSPISVLMLHGDSDPAVGYCADSGTQMATQETTFDYWVGSSANQCSTLSTTAPLCDGTGAVTSVYTKTATDCTGGVEVKFYKLIGGVHTWYSVPMNLPTATAYNPDFNSTTGLTTNDILWNFFESHPKP